MITLKDSDAKEKQTTLKDDAAIYQKREPKSERQKFSELKTFEDKMKYFRMYYLKGLLAVLAIAALGIYIIYTIVSPKDEFLLRVAFVDYLFDSKPTEKMAEDFISASGIEPGEHEIILFDGLSYQVSGGDINAAAVFTAHIMAREIDAVIAPESTFSKYAYNGMTMTSLTETLPADLYAALSDRFFLSAVRKSEGSGDASEEQYVVGLYLDETPFWKEYSTLIRSEERPVVGIVLNSKNKENAVRLLRWLFELPAL